MAVSARRDNVHAPSDTLREIYRELQRRIEGRTLTHADFLELERRARAASGGDGDLLEGFYQAVECYRPEWVPLPSGGTRLAQAWGARDPGSLPPSRAAGRNPRGVVIKEELIAQVAKASGLKKKDATAAVDAFLSKVGAALSGGHKVWLTGFGTFEVRSRKARTGVKPGTTQKIKIPASKYPAFKPGKALKEKVKK